MQAARPKLASPVELLESTTSSHGYMRQPVSPYESVDGLEEGEHGASSVTLDLAIRFGRLAVVTVVAITLLATLTATFHHGVVVGDYDPTDKDDIATKKLLDDYNSYTGNVAAVFSKPIELFVALAVQLVLLRVLTSSVLSAQPNWKMDALALALSAGVGFLLNNSLNALNVQMQPPKIEAFISAADLTYTPEVSAVNSTDRSTSPMHTVSERTPKNPITNTALRNLVLPRVPVAATQCDWASTQNYAKGKVFPDLVLEYGFAQRDWHGRLLQEALEPKQLRMVVNSTNKTAAQAVDPKDLPMSASLAGELFAYSMFVSTHMFPWSGYYTFKDESGSKFPGISLAAVSRSMGVLPKPSQALDEASEREWFLRESGQALLRKLSGVTTSTTRAANTSMVNTSMVNTTMVNTTSSAAAMANTTSSNVTMVNTTQSSEVSVVNTSRSDLVMEFSHVDISPSVSFDAFTIEFEVDPKSFASTTSNDGTRYHTFTQELQCGPWPAQCLMPKPFLVPENQDDVYDPPAQVQVFGSCVNANGTEQLTAKMVSDGAFVKMDCDKISNSSFMIVSIGKRFVADAISQNKTANASGLFSAVENTGSNVVAVTNLRRVFTYTVAKLSWNVSDLTKEFSAKCASDGGSCRGLRFPLAPAPAAPDQNQEIIVGAEALPTSLLTAPLFYYVPRLLPLVKLHEPSSRSTGFKAMYNIVAGDPLLPHNMRNVTWNMQQTRSPSLMCVAFAEDRLHQILNNHMYIEHGLQTAYTAATFFLLQNGVVKDVVQLNDADQRQSLNFQQNKQTVELLASIPKQNAWLTLGGCAVLLVSLFSVIAWSWATSKSNPNGGLGHVTAPHVVARVLLDSDRFPPMFVQRRVVSGSDQDAPAPMADGFLINGIALQPPSQKTAA